MSLSFRTRATLCVLIQGAGRTALALTLPSSQRWIATEEESLIKSSLLYIRIIPFNPLASGLSASSLWKPRVKEHDG